MQRNDNRPLASTGRTTASSGWFQPAPVERHDVAFLCPICNKAARGSPLLGDILIMAQRQSGAQLIDLALEDAQMMHRWY